MLELGCAREKRVRCAGLRVSIRQRIVRVELLEAVARQSPAVCKVRSPLVPRLDTHAMQVCGQQQTDASDSEGVLVLEARRQAA